MIRDLSLDHDIKSAFTITAIFPRGTSLIGKSVRDFFKTKGFIGIFDGFFLKTKGFLPKVYEILESEMPLEFFHVSTLFQNLE